MWMLTAMSQLHKPKSASSILAANLYFLPIPSEANSEADGDADSEADSKADSRQ